jgi:hypothetical protein
MKKEKNKKGLELIEENLDPLSDRYRICPNPSCKKPHMVKNRGRDYCSDKCADDHYNLIRKYREQFETDREKKVEAERSIIAAEQQKAVYMKPDPEWQKIHENNIEIFSSLTIDPVKGTKYLLNYLLSLGVNLFTHTAKAKLHNIDEKYGVHYLIFGDFKLYLIDYNVVLIYYNHNQTS